MSGVADYQEIEGDGVRIQTCINAAAGSCTIDH